MSRGAAIHGVLWALVLLSRIPTGAAQPSPAATQACARAEAANERALQRYDLLLADEVLQPGERRELRAARDALLEAQRLCPSADYLNNLARVSAVLGALDVALRYCLDCVDALAPTPPASVRQLCADLQARRGAGAAEVVVDSEPAGAEVIVEGDETTAFATPVTLHLEPESGVHYRVLLRSEGYADVLWEPAVTSRTRIERRFRLVPLPQSGRAVLPSDEVVAPTVTPGETRAGAPSPAAPAAPAAPPSPAVRPGPRWPALAALGCAVASAAVASAAVGLHVSSLRLSSAADDELDGTPAGATAYYEQSAEGQRRARLAGLLYGGAGLLAGAGVLLWLMPEPRAPAGTGRVRVTPTPGGAVATWRF